VRDEGARTARNPSTGYRGQLCEGPALVFDVEKNPWVDPDAASIDEVKNAIRNCPSGALTMKQL
jgi:uncharacterized Fe-S cluster protein YjdI